MAIARVMTVVGAVAALMVGAGAHGQVANNPRPSTAKALLEQNPAMEFDPGSVLVKFKPGVTWAQYTSTLRGVGGTFVKAYQIVPDLEHIRVGLPSQQAAAALMASGHVVYAEPDYVVRHTATPNDTYYNLQWGLHNTGQTVNNDPGIADADIDAPEAWDTSTGDANFVIADIDNGAHLAHPDLAANIWVNPGEIANNSIDDDGNGYVDDVNGWDFYSNDRDPSDAEGHGSHTAGTIGAVGNNGIGVAGVNWRCKLMVLRFLGPTGGFTSDAIEAVQYCAAKGVKVSNNSWGGGGFSQALFDAINASKSVGHLFVAAAGNGGADQIGDNNDSIPFYPANYNLDNVISVAASDNNDGRAGFSNYGLTTVDIAAPGVNIASTWINSGYVYNNGTSMACPHVSGVAGLVYALNPTWTYGQVRTRIFQTARPVSAFSGRCVTGGIVNLQAAIGTPPANTPPSVSIGSPSNGSSFTQGASVTFTGSASDTQDGNISANLAWTSSINGSIGSGGSFSTSSLSLGTHTITASVTDSGGLPGSASITVTINTPPANTPPTVTITAPGNGSSFTQGASVTFTGSANDTQDGNISASLAWTSSINGSIGSGGSFSTSTLALGTHTITASVTDSGGLPGSASITVTINPPTATPPAAPSNVTVTRVSSTTARVNWSDNSNNETTFEIQRERRVGSSWTGTTTVGTVGANVTTFTNSPGNGRWRYRVRAVNGAGASSYTAWVEIRL